MTLEGYDLNPFPGAKNPDTGIEEENALGGMMPQVPVDQPIISKPETAESEDYETDLPESENQVASSIATEDDENTPSKSEISDEESQVEHYDNLNKMNEAKAKFEYEEDRYNESYEGETYGNVKDKVTGFANESVPLSYFIYESVKSKMTDDFKVKGKLKLSSFKKVHITEEIIKKYKNKYSCLRHIRCKDTKEYICDGYLWLDNDQLVCTVGSCKYRDDSTKWIVSLEVMPKYKGYGLSRQILDFAVKTMKCKYLSVNKSNEIAKHVYDKYGFKVYQESDTMYYMCYGVRKPVTESNSDYMTNSIKEFCIESEYEEDNQYNESYEGKTYRNVEGDIDRIRESLITANKLRNQMKFEEALKVANRGISDTKKLDEKINSLDVKKNKPLISALLSSMYKHKTKVKTTKYIDNHERGRRSGHTTYTVSHRGKSGTTIQSSSTDGYDYTKNKAEASQYEYSKIKKALYEVSSSLRADLQTIVNLSKKKDAHPFKMKFDLNTLRFMGDKKYNAYNGRMLNKSLKKYTEDAKVKLESVEEKLQRYKDTPLYPRYLKEYEDAKEMYDFYMEGVEEEEPDFFTQTGGMNSFSSDLFYEEESNDNENNNNDNADNSSENSDSNDQSDNQDNGNENNNSSSDGNSDDNSNNEENGGNNNENNQDDNNQNKENDETKNDSNISKNKEDRNNYKNTLRYKTLRNSLKNAKERMDGATDPNLKKRYTYEYKSIKNEIAEYERVQRERKRESADNSKNHKKTLTKKSDVSKSKNINESVGTLAIFGGLGAVLASGAIVSNIKKRKELSKSQTITNEDIEQLSPEEYGIVEREFRKAYNEITKEVSKGIKGQKAFKIADFKFGPWVSYKNKDTKGTYLQIVEWRLDDFFTDISPRAAMEDDQRQKEWIKAYNDVLTVVKSVGKKYGFSEADDLGDWDDGVIILGKKGKCYKNKSSYNESYLESSGAGAYIDINGNKKKITDSTTKEVKNRINKNNTDSYDKADNIRMKNEYIEKGRKDKKDTINNYKNEDITAKDKPVLVSKSLFNNTYKVKFSDKTYKKIEELANLKGDVFNRRNTVLLNDIMKSLGIRENYSSVMHLAKKTRIGIKKEVQFVLYKKRQIKLKAGKLLYHVSPIKTNSLKPSYAEKSGVRHYSSGRVYFSLKPMKLSQIDMSKANGNSYIYEYKLPHDTICYADTEYGASDNPNSFYIETEQNIPVKISKNANESALFDVTYNESAIIPRDNLEFNMEKWVPGKHALWITGTSGDGKSTLAKKIADEHDAILITFDVFLDRIGRGEDGWKKIESKFKKSNPNDPTFNYINEHPELPYDFPTNDTSKTEYFTEFGDWVRNTVVKKMYKNKLVVIEGCDICRLDPSIMSKEPLIIMGISSLQCSLRRIKRDLRDNEGLLKSIFKEIKRLTGRPTGQLKTQFTELSKLKKNFEKDVKSVYKEDAETFSSPMERFYNAKHSIPLKNASLKEDDNMSYFSDMNDLFKESTMFEAAQISDEMKPIIAKLNAKGYKTKYSSPGYLGERSKKDTFRDGVKNGKVYSTARIMFDGDYKFPPAPKGWEWRQVDNKDYLDVVEKSFDYSDTTPPDRVFAEWKAEYMASLREWVDELEPVSKRDGDSSRNPTKVDKTKDEFVESFVENMCENLLLDSENFMD